MGYLSLPGDGSHNIELKSRYPGRTALSASSSRITGTLDTAAPEFTITAPVSDSVTVNNKNYTLKGTREEASCITINNTTVVSVGTSGTSWEYPITLAEGDNTFKIKSTDEAGNTAEGKVIHFVYENIAPAVVDSFIIIDTPNGDSAVVNWSAYKNSETHGDIANYRVYHKTENFTDVSTMSANIVQASESGTTLINLTKNTTCYFAVQAVDTAGNRSAIVTKEYTLSDTDAPIDVQNLKADAEKYSITFSWNASPSNDVVEYHAYFCKTPDVGNPMPDAWTQNPIILSPEIQTFFPEAGSPLPEACPYSLKLSLLTVRVTKAAVYLSNQILCSRIRPALL